MSAWDPEMLEREADERFRRLDAEHTGHLIDTAYASGTRHGMACLAYLLSQWLDVEYDAAGSPAHADWIDRVGAEVDRLEMAGMPEPLPEYIARLVASDC